jgi:hypothetical protein
VSDTFRRKYRELSDADKEHVDAIKDAAERLESLILNIPHYYSEDYGRVQGRHISLAFTNLEQAVMWAVKAAT